MKFVVIALMTVSLLACSAPSSPRSPSAPTSPNPTFTSGVARAIIWPMAVDVAGFCIIPATLEIVRGQGAGENFAQEPAPCGNMTAGFPFWKT